MTDKIRRYLVDLPPWHFWAFFFLMTWCFFISKIVAIDLWWHMACGRFLIENGFYPPTGTFTFSPVNPTTSNIATWFGDIVLYLIYWCSGKTGLQIFKFLLMLIPVVVLISVSGKRYNFWLLLTSVLVVIGLMQISVLRNSIYALFFLPLIVWVWWYIQTRGTGRAYFLILIYPPIIGLWSVMHGYALVGTVIVILIFAGEILDLFFKKDPRKIFKGSLFLFVAVSCYLVVNINLSLNLSGVVSSFLKSSGQTVTEKVETEKITPETETDLGNKFNFLGWIKTKVRFLGNTGDVGFIAEFNSPLDNMRMMPSKALVTVSLLYLFYLFCALIISPSSIRLSFALPSIASIILGLGYLRTVPFPFLVAVPFMVSGISDLAAIVKGNDRPLFQLLKHKNLVYVNILPLAGGFLFLGGLYFYLLQNQFSIFTGLSYIGPGVGLADIHKSRLPEHVLENYPDEPMFNSYNTGSRLLWEWYGKKKIFIDSRSITYRQDFYDDFRGNYSFEAFQKMNLNKALLSPLMDVSWYEAYFKLNWNLICFDTGMMLMERREKEGYDVYYGKVPKFLGTPEDVRRMAYESKELFGFFLNLTIKYMLLFGRLEDALNFYSSIEPVVERLPSTEVQGSLKVKYRLMTDVKDDFGKTNSSVLAGLFREIFLNDKEMRQDAFLDYDRSKMSIYVAFANAHLEFGNQRKAIDYFMKAADTDEYNLDLQVKIGDHFFKIKALGPAIRQYQRVVAMDSRRVHEYNKLGFLYYQKGELKQARESFESAVKADSDVIESYVNLAAVLLEENKEKALEVIRKGLEKEPDNPQLKDMLKDLGSGNVK